MIKWIKDQIEFKTLKLALVYTAGHILIAATCSYVITGAALELATLDAIVEPLINAVWLYILVKMFKEGK